MADINKVIVIDVENNASNDMNKIKDTLDAVDKSTKAANETTKSLKEQYREVIKELQSGKLSGKEFDEATKRAGGLKDQIGDINQRVKNLASDTQKLDGILSVGSGIVGGFAAAQGAAALFGGESEELQKTLVKVQGSLALLNGIQAVANTLNKDSAASTTLAATAQKGYALAVGTSTGAMKAFRIALISTGVGALVVGLGLLIANFEKVSEWTENAIDKLRELSPPINLIMMALEKLGIIESKEFKAAEKNRLKSIETLNKQKDSIEEKYNSEIRLAKAAGKDTTKLEAEKRKAILLTLQALNDAERARVNSGEATKEEIETWNKRQGDIKKIIEDGKVAELEAEKKSEDKKKVIQDKANAERIKRQEKADADEKKRKDDILKLNEDYAKKIQDLDADTDEKKLKLEREREEKRLTELEATEDQKLKLKELYDRKEEDLLKAKQDRITAIEDEYKNKSRELNAVTDEEKLQLELTKQKEEEARKIAELEKEGATEEQKKAIKDYYIDLANQTQSDYNQKRAEDETALNDLLIEQELKFQEVKRNVLDNVLDLLSQFAGKNKAIAIGILAVQKGLAIADIVTKASSSIAGAVASTGAANMAAKAFYAPAGPAGAVAAGAEIGINTGLLAKTIAATKISAGINIASILGSTITSMKSNIGGGGAVAGGGAGGGGAVQPQAEFNIVGQSSTNQLAETIAGQQQQPVEAFVVGSSVTSQQELDRNRIQNSTFI